MHMYAVRSTSGGYRISCGRGAIRKLKSAISKEKGVTGVYVLSSPKVWKNCGRTAGGVLGSTKSWKLILFNDAEDAKSLSTVEKVCRDLHRAGADRGAVIVALGGGVVGDIAGFVAASYLRGVRVIHVPTTLVAQIDSSIGGKTGVNLAEGKNLVGAFYPPVAVISDPIFLKSLPEAQFCSGIYEAVKYGVICDAKLFTYLESSMRSILRRDPRAMEWITDRSVHAKSRVVAEDERESGLRQILNFGHTFGHALETVGKYRRHLHGEAVAWGMIVATLLAVATNRITSEQAQRIIRVVISVRALPPIGSARTEKFIAMMRGDKKSRGGCIRWVLPTAIGRVEWGVEIPDRIVAAAIREAPDVARLARA